MGAFHHMVAFPALASKGILSHQKNIKMWAVLYDKSPFFIEVGGGSGWVGAAGLRGLT